jgi:hypothetical protein
MDLGLNGCARLIITRRACLPATAAVAATPAVAPTVAATATRLYDTHKARHSSIQLQGHFRRVKRKSSPTAVAGGLLAAWRCEQRAQRLADGGQGVQQREVGARGVVALVLILQLAAALFQLRLQLVFRGRAVAVAFVGSGVGRSFGKGARKWTSPRARVGCVAAPPHAPERPPLCLMHRTHAMRTHL